MPTVEELTELLRGKTVLQVEQLPYILVRWDWLTLVMRWLGWAQSQMKPEKLDLEGVGDEQMRAFVDRCFTELEELQRVGKAVTLGSPLVYMRTEGGLPPEVQYSMPPRDPSEKGN